MQVILIVGVRGEGAVGHCDGVKDWFMCLKCESLCSVECPIHRGDIEELIRQINVLQVQRQNDFSGGIDDSVGHA